MKSAWCVRGLRGPGRRAIGAGLRRGRAWPSTSCWTGPTRLSHLAVTRYDVVVLDRDLPGVHGDEVCRRLVGQSFAAAGC